jgi:maltose alpha-D-glucosyltransferase/alpha-amylase
MRVNVGIRRRLAPLLDNDPDKIRLMFSLLLSMPGSPILYYGDELGMGDNIYLGDRNGVRTPMQWSPDRNAGFSRADPQRLYLPPVMDPVYGYLSVNVEAQAREAPSLLNWMRRVIAVRRAHRVFGRGTLDMLHPGNRRILAYVREHGEGEAAEAVLCVANLGRGAEPVELDLGRFRGRVPVELLGETAFPPIGALPYLLTLPGHGFYWFLLSREADAPAWHQEHLPRVPLRTLVLPEGWWSLDPARAERRAPAERARGQLEGEVLPAWLAGRRWLAAGAGEVQRAALMECQPWRDWLLARVRVERAGGGAEDCFLPLRIVWEDAPGLAGETPLAGAAIARVRRHALPGTLYDGLADPALIRALTEAVGADRELPFGTGRLRGRRGSAYPDEPADAPRVEILPEGAVGDALIDGRLRFTARRLLCRGRDLEAEIGRHLTEVAPVSCVRPLAGTLDFLPGDDAHGPLTLALVQRWVPDQGDLWSEALAMLARLIEEHLDQVEDWETDPARVGYATLLEALGRRLAELHLALAAPGGSPDFAPEPVAPADLVQWRGLVLAAGHAAFQCLDGLVATPDGPGSPGTGVRVRARALLERRAEVVALIARLTPAHLPQAKIRVHGDLHLGRVLGVECDVLIEGFGGEAVGACVPRPAKLPGLADLAALRESLHAVAATALAVRAQARPGTEAGLESALRQWRRAAEGVLTAAYRVGCGDGAGHQSPPDGSVEASALLRLLALGRALTRLARTAAGPGASEAVSRRAALDTLVSVLDDWGPDEAHPQPDR